MLVSLKRLIADFLRYTQTLLVLNSNARLERKGQLYIGQKSYTNTNPLVWAARSQDTVSIGDYCSISYKVSIVFPGNHDLSADSTHPDFVKQERGPAAVKIGNNVWIGFGATLLAPISIGDGAIIGAGAVVTNDVAANTTVGGVPAKIIRSRKTS